MRHIVREIRRQAFCRKHHRYVQCYCIRIWTGKKLVGMVTDNAANMVKAFTDDESDSEVCSQTERLKP